MKKDELKALIPGDIIDDVDIDEPFELLTTLAGRYLDSDSVLNLLEAVVSKKIGYEYYDVIEDTIVVNPSNPNYFKNLQELSDRMMNNAASLRLKADAMVEEAELLEKEASRYQVK